MKVLQINSVYKNGGSTGRIVYDLKRVMEESGIESYVAFGYEYSPTNDKNTYCISSIPALKISILQTRIEGRHGYFNVTNTKKLLKWIDKIKPDLIHLHNIHGHYINVFMLFDYIKKKEIPVVWTLHDCWSFTGWCAHFDYIGCEKWKTHCMRCKNYKEYPFTWFFDQSYKNYDDKMKCFQGVKNMTIVTPSNWLSERVKESFLKEYPVKTINNGIDTSTFNMLNNSNIKDEIGVGNRKMILAMAMNVSKLKGFDYIIALNNFLDHKKECIVVVGLKDEQIQNLPSGIIGMKRITDINRLVQLYSSADVFVNPTLQDTFPTTNLEAQACGTPVVTFRTGGSPESISKDCGIVVEKGNIKELYSAIEYILTNYDKNNRESCARNVMFNYDKEQRFRDYVSLYDSIIH